MTRTIFKDNAAVQPLLSDFSQAVKAVNGVEKRGIVGFDGFIDTFIRFHNPATMADFGREVSANAGIATSAGVKREGEKFGGNGPLMAVGLQKLFTGRIGLDYIGALGLPEILPIYTEAFAGGVDLHSFADPATSDCLEFTDGKVMLSDMSNCEAMTWESLTVAVGEEKLNEIVAGRDFIAAVNWGKIINATEIWERMADLLSGSGKDKTFYMDLAEFSQRSDADKNQLPEMFAYISERCHSMISLNLKEGWQLAALFGGSFADRRAPEEVADCADFIREKSGINEVIIHPNDGAVISQEKETVYAAGPFCGEPLISTGAGDHFGSGALSAHLLGFSALESMLLGGAASGYFVRTGISPSLAQIAELADLWQAGKLTDRI